MFKRITIVLSAVCVMASSISCLADNAKANASFSQGITALKSKKFREAASLFTAAELYADDAVTKANAIKAASKSYRYANLLYQEFKEIEKLLGGFPTHVNFEKMVTREFEIAEKYFDGYREQEYKYFTWVKGDDKTVEVYEKALSRGPFAAIAPKGKLRLGRIYLKQGKRSKALKAFEEVSTQYPQSAEQKYGYLELGNALIQMARQSDGDGAYAKRAKSVLKEILQKYPDDQETTWVNKALVEIDEIAAKRLHGVATYYKRTGQEQIAQTYLKEVLREYPETKTAEKSENVLSEIDTDYVAPIEDEEKITLSDEGQLVEDGKIIEELGKKLNSLTKIPKLHDNADVIDIVPENSNGRWLLPIRKLDPTVEIVISEEELERERRAELAKLAAAKRLKAKEALRKIISEEKALADARTALDEVLAQNKEIHLRLKAEYAQRKTTEKLVKTEMKNFSDVSGQIDKVSKDVEMLISRSQVTATAENKTNLIKLVSNKLASVAKANLALTAKKNIISDIKATDKNKLTAQRTAKSLAEKVGAFDPNEEVSLNDPDKIIARLKALEDTRKNILAQLTEQQKVTGFAKSEVIGEQKAKVEVNNELKARKNALKFAQDELQARKQQQLELDESAAQKVKEKTQKEQLEKKRQAEIEAQKKIKEAADKAKKEAASVVEKKAEKVVAKPKGLKPAEEESSNWPLIAGLVAVVVIIGGFIKFKKKA